MAYYYTSCKGNPNLFFHNYIEEIEKMISNHALLRKTRKRELKFQSKPWITSGLQKPIVIKNEPFGKFIKQSKKITMTSILKIISITWKIPGKESDP